MPNNDTHRRDDTNDRIARVCRRMGVLTSSAQIAIWNEAKAQHDVCLNAEAEGDHNPNLTLDCFENALDMLAGDYMLLGTKLVHYTDMPGHYDGSR